MVTYTQPVQPASVRIMNLQKKSNKKKKCVYMIFVFRIMRATFEYGLYFMFFTEWMFVS